MDSVTSSWDPKHYSQHSSPQFNAAMLAVNDYPFRGDETVLDIGCGDGRITREIAIRVPHGQVLGADVSKEMISFSQKTHTDLDNLSFELCAAEVLPYVNRFDLVTSSFALHWVSDKALAFHKVFECLKPGAFASILVGKVEPNYYAAVCEVVDQDQWKSYFTEYVNPFDTLLDDQYEEYIKQSGLLVEQYEVVPSVGTLPNYSEIFNWFVSVTPHRLQLPSETLQTQFMQDVMARFKVSEVDGQYPLNMPYIKALMKKPG